MIPPPRVFDIRPFNPFKKRGPLAGWFEVPYAHQERWDALAEQALHTLKSNA